MDIKAIPKNEQSSWVTCSKRVDGGASRIRGWHHTKDCGYTARWVVDGKRYCTKHKNELVAEAQRP